MTNNKPNPKTDGKFLSAIFLMHAAGTKITAAHCPVCGKVTAFSKTTRDIDWYCLECLTPSTEDLSK